jgi:diguanylate cyclase (GGDEF)-like protein/PAS domain S-box-containing protein
METIMPWSAEVQESERLAALQRLHLMDTPPEPEFDELVRLAAAICEVPICLMTLLDDQRQWFKATFGVEVKETTREVAFCNHTIRQSDLLVVEDTTLDTRLAKNPEVTGGARYRFYAGMPIRTLDGYAVGSLCVLDMQPRQLTPAQIEAMRILGNQVNAQLELREQRMELARLLRSSEIANASLAASERRFQAFMDCSPFISYMKDEEGRIIFHNRNLPSVLGMPDTIFLGKTDFELWPEKYAKELRCHELEVIRSQQLKVLDEVSVNPDGSERHWRSYKFLCPGEDGSMLLGGVSIDLTKEMQQDAELRRYQRELEEVNARLRELVGTDPMTGLLNRRAFDERLGVEYAIARRSERPLSLLLMDIDNFKLCNDRHGHDIGDKVLIQFAAVLRRAMREGDICVRYGGEEFIALLPDTDEEEAVLIGERLLAAVRASAWPHVRVTTSIGTASLTQATPFKEHLITLADEALYEAKRAGKDRLITHGNYFKTLMESGRSAGAAVFSSPAEMQTAHP